MAVSCRIELLVAKYGIDFRQQIKSYSVLLSEFAAGTFWLNNLLKKEISSFLNPFSRKRLTP